METKKNKPVTGPETLINVGPEWEYVLNHRLAIEKLISQISSNFLNLSLEEIDNGIIYALQLISEFSGIEKSQLFSFSDNLTNAYLTHEWCQEDLGGQERISVGTFLWMIKKLKNSESIHISASSKITSTEEKEILAVQNIKSALFIPISYKNNLIGFLSFYSFKKVKVWTEEDISLLKMIGEIFVNSLERKYALEKWKVLVESTDDCILVADFESALFIEANPAARKLFGYSLEEFRALKGKNLHPEDVYDILRTFSFNLNNYGNSYNPDIKMLKKNGTVFWGSVKGNVYEVAGQKLLVIIIRDITEQKKAEQKLKESERLLEQAQKIAHIGSWELNMQTGKISWSDELYRIFGLDPSTPLTSDTILSFINSEDEELYLKTYKEALKAKGAYSFEYRIRRQDGAVRVLLTQSDVITDKEGNPVKFIGTAQDITERKNSEARIYEQAELLDKAQDAIIVRDLNYNVIFWNKSAERLYGWTKEEIYSKRDTDEINIERTDELVEAQGSILEKGEWLGELHQLTKAGNEIIVQSRWNLIFDDSGRPKSILTVNTDITEKKKIEAKYLRAQRMESIGTLTGGIAHDLNNILTPIMMSVEILKMDLTDKKRKEILDTLESGVKRGADIISQLLLFARGEPEKENITVNIPLLVENISRIIRETFPKSIDFTAVSNEGLYSVSGNITQLEQMLLNLCVNARDAMPYGGKLTIKAENIFIDEAFARLNLAGKAGSYVCIEVTDNGTGIPAEMSDKIFEPFFTTKETGKGTGLGLSSASGIIKRHSGFITLSSEVGKGSCFKIYLPASDSHYSECNAGEQPEELKGHGELILIVDDEAPVLELLRESLEAFGYSVLSASNGFQAIELFSDFRKEIRLVLTDISMPGIDGVKVAKVLRQNDPNVKILLSSGLTTSSEAAEVFCNFETGFLAKPYSTLDLLRKIKEVIS